MVFPKDKGLFRVLHRPPQVSQFLLPVAEGRARDHPAVLEWISHNTLVALRIMRNIMRRSGG